MAVSHIHSLQVVAFVVRDDDLQIGLLEAGEGALSIVAYRLLVAPSWGLGLSKMEKGWHASTRYDQL